MSLANLGLGMEVASSATNIAGGLVDLIGRRRRREEQFAREDNAVQRRASDLEAAGLSKTLAAGSAASATPVSARSTQTKSGVSQAVLANAQKELTNQKINESKTQEDLNRSATNLNDERAGLTRQQAINAGYTATGLDHANTLSGDRAANIPRERDLFESIGWTYYKDAPGHLTGEVARLMSSLGKGGAGLSKTVISRLQPIAEEAQARISSGLEVGNNWIQEQIDKVPGLFGQAKDGAIQIFNNVFRRNQ